MQDILMICIMYSLKMYSLGYCEINRIIKKNKKKINQLKMNENTSALVTAHDDNLLSCQPRVTVTSCFVYKVIRDL